MTARNGELIGMEIKRTRVLAQMRASRFAGQK